jgi:cobaltochelatase CobN
MHKIIATPGGWNSDSEGVIFIEQTPAPIVFLTAADTDIQTLAACLPHLPAQFPAVRAVNLLQLQQQLSIDNYAEIVLGQAKVIVLRLLGGKSYWSYGLEVLKEISQESGAFLLVLPGDNRPDPDLMSHSTVSLAIAHRLWCYLTEGGVENWINALQFIADVCLGSNYHPPLPLVVPLVGIYPRKNAEINAIAKVGLLFYRAHYLAGNTLPFDAICQALEYKKLEPIPVFISSLRDPDVQENLLTYFYNSIQLLLNTTSFSLAKIGTEDRVELWQKLNVPVLQVILSSTTQENWQKSFQGLTPRDVAMNVALPEVDGRIITRAISFKSVKSWNERLETDVVVYQPKRDRIDFVTDLTANWINLRQITVCERKIALILANYPNRDGRIANGVGLDTPASCLEILKALQNAGYFVRDIPENGDELIRRLTSGVTNDREGNEIRPVHQKLSINEYQKYFSGLPEKVQKEISDRWRDLNSDQS